MLKIKNGDAVVIPYDLFQKAIGDTNPDHYSFWGRPAEHKEGMVGIVNQESNYAIKLECGTIVKERVLRVKCNNKQHWYRERVFWKPQLSLPFMEEL